MTISTTSQGLKPGVCTSANRPANPFDGQVIYMTDVDQTAVWDGTQWTVLAPIASGRNVIINGGFDVWQRGTTATVTGPSYLADRFVGSVSGGGGATESRDTDVPSGQGFRYSWKHAATTTTSFSQMGQQIEFANCKHLQNKTVTISFWAKAINSNAGSTSLYVRTRTVAGVDGTVLFSGSASATTITLTTSWAKYTITKTLPASFGSLSLEFALSSHVSGDGFFLTGVQLEAGAVATPFEFEDYGTTLAKCQRYFQTYVDPPLRGVSDTTTRPTRMGMVLPVRMRVAPTSYSFSGSLGFWDGNTVGFYASTQQAFLSATSLEFDFNLTVGYAAGRAIVLYTGNGGTMTISAEF